MSTSWRRDKKEYLFYRTPPSDYSWILRLFSFRTKEGTRAYVEEENEILQRDNEENSLALYNIKHPDYFIKQERNNVT